MLCTARSVGSRTVDTPSDNLQCFPYVYLFVTGHNNIHHPLPSAPASLKHKCDFSKISSNFQNILVAVFHIDKPIDFLEKNLSYRSVGRCLQYCPASARSDSRRSVLSDSLGVCSEQRAAELSAGRNAADSSVNRLKTAFPSTCRSLTVWTFKYKHNLSVNMRIVCYSDAGSALNETKVI